MKTYIVILAAFLTSTVLRAQSNFEQGLAAYKKRSENVTTRRAPSENIVSAMRFFEKAFTEDQKEMAIEYYIRSCYFKATYCDNTKDEKVKTLTKGKEIGQKAIEQFPTTAGIRYWYAVSIGARAKEMGVVAAAKEGVIDKLKDECEKIIELDPNYDDGAGYRFLGILHLDAPYIPFFLPWPDDEKAVELLRKGLKNNPQHISGQYYLAKALNEIGEKEEAIEILKKVTLQKPDSDYYLEHLSELDLCKSLLKDLTS